MCAVRARRRPRDEAALPARRQGRTPRPRTGRRPGPLQPRQGRHLRARAGRGHHRRSGRPHRRHPRRRRPGRARVAAGLAQRGGRLPEVPVGLNAHPESGDISNNRASRIAVSAVIPRRPRTTSFRRFRGMSMRRAASTCVRFAGRRNSSSSISPGGVGGRSRSSTDRGPSVVVLASDRIGATSLEPECDPIPLVNPQAVAPGPVALQRLQTIARGQPQIPNRQRGAARPTSGGSRAIAASAAGGRLSYRDRSRGRPSPHRRTTESLPQDYTTNG